MTAAGNSLSKALAHDLLRRNWRYTLRAMAGIWSRSGIGMLNSRNRERSAPSRWSASLQVAITVRCDASTGSPMYSSVKCPADTGSSSEYKEPSTGKLLCGALSSSSSISKPDAEGACRSDQTAPFFAELHDEWLPARANPAVVLAMSTR